MLQECFGLLFSSCADSVEALTLYSTRRRSSPTLKSFSSELPAPLKHSPTIARQCGRCFPAKLHLRGARWGNATGCTSDRENGKNSSFE